LPEMYGHPAHGTWWGPFNYSATAVYAGALALPLAAAGLARCRRDRRWLALGVTAALAFAAAYHWPGVRELLGALPLIGRAAQHRLLFGVELGIALLAGAGCDEWLAGRGRGILAGAAAAAALLTAAWTLHRGDWAVHGLLITEAAWTAAVAAAALLLALSVRLGRGWRFRLAPLLPALALCDLLAAHGAINPGLPLERLYPRTGAVRFLAAQPGRVAGTGEALRPNAAMVYGLHDPRGDDPVKLASYEAVYQRFAAGDPVYFQPVERWASPWLDRLGVRWVVASPGEAPPAPGWRLAYAGADARVYERLSALPLVRWALAAGAASPTAAAVPGLLPAATAPLPAAVPPVPAGRSSPGLPGVSAGAAPAPAPLSPSAAAAAAAGGGWAQEGLAVIRREPGRWEIGWRAAEPRLLVVAETWAPGWRALVDGQPRPVEAAAGALLGVRLGPGAGRAELRYRPPGLLAGALISAAAVLALAAIRRAA
ncbi:MAG: YfhO family protein, partial [Acidobacteria bacterium]|nr:YfhO family protein [Acidobacteriota bacterium]